MPTSIYRAMSFKFKISTFFFIRPHPYVIKISQNMLLLCPPVPKLVSLMGCNIVYEFDIY